VVNLSLLIKIGGSLFLLVAGAFINRLFERRPRLIVFYGHVGRFHVQPPQPPLSPQPGIVHTHWVVIRNSGRVAAQNVHVPHNLMLTNNVHISIDPALAHTVQSLPNNTEEILFPTLPAKFQVTVSYLYFPPLLFNQINAPIYSDEGQAQFINVLLQKQWPKWQLAVLWILVFVGLITILYWIFIALERWVVF
jgi:hypothetical protein